MPRARNIKHSFFTNDELAEYNCPLGRLLFVGLWCHADYKGDLEWRPTKLKVQILPYDECDINTLAINLDKSGFISFYSDGKKVYLHIRNFEKHQNPHKNERDKGSDVPGYTEKLAQLVDLKTLTINLDKNGENHEGYASDPADSCFLIPDSGPPQNESGPEKSDRVPVQKIIDLYNSIANHLPASRVQSDAMKNHIRGRWKQDAKFQTLEFWQEFFEYCENNTFLSGRSEPGRGREKPFRADLDWITRPTNFANIINLKYDGNSETAAA